MRITREKRFEEGNSYIVSRGGQNLQPIIGFQRLFKINCSANHAFTLNLKELRLGNWCKKCNQSYSNIWFDEMSKRVSAKGGTMVSTPDLYINSRSKLEIICGNGHNFHIVMDKLSGNRWCPHCRLHVGEAVTVQILSKLTGKPFTKIRPDWLKWNCNLELDGYNDDLKLAVEYQGKQHYKYRSTSNFHKDENDFIELQKRDKFKKERCSELGIILIEVPFTIAIKDIQTFLCKILTDKNIPHTQDKIIIDYNSIVKIRIYSIEADRLINEKNGLCVIPTISDPKKTILQITCTSGHVFETTLSYLRRNSWCPECGKKRVKDKGLLKFPCTVENCSKTYQRQDKLTQHMKEKHGVLPISNGLIKYYQENPRPLIDQNLTEKICKKCLLTKDIDQFHKVKKTSDKLRPNCHACRQIDKNKWRQSVKEKVNQGLLQFPCTVENCSKTYQTQDGLTHHMKKHGILPTGKEL